MNAAAAPARTASAASPTSCCTTSCSAAAAARTSVLARRWRHVWAHLPQLHLVAPPRVPELRHAVAPREPELRPVAPRAAAAAAASFLDAVDGALAGYLAPTLGHLNISLHHLDESITAGRVAPWLQFAAERMVGEICLSLPVIPARLSEAAQVVEDDEAVVLQVLELPPCQGAKRIKLLLTHEWQLCLQASGVFVALTSMMISSGRIKGADLTSLVCTQCPCLRDLTLSVELIVVSDVSFHSDSLCSVYLFVTNARRLEVVAPKLEKLAVHFHPLEAHISAPKLAELVWSARAYDPHLHRFADVGRSLRLLEISTTSMLPSLVEQLDEVDELRLHVSISAGLAGYENLLNETNELPKCNRIRIFLEWGHHALVSSILQLFKRCTTAKKISVLLLTNRRLPLLYFCPPSCACHLEENHKFDGIALSSLEEVEIFYFTDSLEDMKLVEFLSCNATILKRLVINYMMLFDPALIKEVCEKVRGICRANVKVKFNVFRRGRLVPFD